MIAALTLLLVLAAAEPTGTLLACQGTKTDKDPNTSLYDKPQPISAGLIIDFTNGTIKGFPFNAEIKITEVTEVAVHFAAYEKIANNTHQIDGGIDRVTADVVAYSLVYKDYGSSIYEEAVSYSLLQANVADVLELQGGRYARDVRRSLA